jgi:hypothetical protein
MGRGTPRARLGSFRRRLSTEYTDGGVHSGQGDVRDAAWRSLAAAKAGARKGANVANVMKVTWDRGGCSSPQCLGGEGAACPVVICPLFRL